MKKNILLLLVTLSFIMPLQAQLWNFRDYCCGRNVYGKILTVANFLQDTSINGNTTSYKPGFIISASLGYRLNCDFSLEAEYAFRRNLINHITFFVNEGDSNNGHYQASSYMVNLLWDVPCYSWKCLFWNGQPFIGAGVGWDYIQMHSSNSRVVFQQDWYHLSWQLIAGLEYPFLCNTDLTLEYRFHQGNTHFYNHTLGVGIVYNFGS